MDLKPGVATKVYEEKSIQGWKLSNKLIYPDRGCLVWHDKAELTALTLHETPQELCGLGLSSTHLSESEPLNGQQHESHETQNSPREHKATPRVSNPGDHRRALV